MWAQFKKKNIPIFSLSSSCENDIENEKYASNQEPLSK